MKMSETVREGREVVLENECKCAKVRGAVNNFNGDNWREIKLLCGVVGGWKNE